MESWTRKKINLPKRLVYDYQPQELLNQLREAIKSLTETYEEIKKASEQKNVRTIDFKLEREKIHFRVNKAMGYPKRVYRIDCKPLQLVA